MRKLAEFRNVHKGEDIYVLASGKSVDFVDNSFFQGKIVIGVNQAFKKVECRYLIRKESALARAVIASQHGSMIFVSKGDCGGVGNHNEKLLRAAPETLQRRLCVFDHITNVHEVRFPTKDDQLLVSYSTITTAIHLAAYMGAKNVILVGHDCGTIDGQANFSGYHTNETYRIAHSAGEKGYVEWLKGIEKHTVQVKEWLRKKYGCNVLSLNPFVSLGLEGHRYAK